jgi:hypothetical protein
MIQPAGSNDQPMGLATGKPRTRITLAMIMVALGCGPEPGDPGEDHDVPGQLEYEQLYNRLYRLDRRVDASFAYPGTEGEDWRCGLLTDRAYDELESTLAALDPSADYGQHRPDCDTHGALIYIAGFEHSPFACSYECCHPVLSSAAVVYSVILNNFVGGYPVVEGERYVAIEPELPCQ